MVNDFLVKFTEQYHDLGHAHPFGLHDLDNIDKVNIHTDRIAGLGHRIVAGHDFHGLLDAEHIGGLRGIESWFDHMLKDFTSHDGIPLPGAHVLHELSGTDFHHAIEWLCIDAADVLEVGGEAAVLGYLEKISAEQPLKYEAALAVGAALGIVDNNPLLVAYAAYKSAEHINSRFKLLSERQLEVLQVFGSKIWRGIEYTAVGTFSAVSILDYFGIDVFDILDHAGAVLHTIDIAHSAADAVGITEGIVDGIATLGLGIAVGRTVKFLVNTINGPARKEIRDLSECVLRKSVLKDALANTASPATLLMILSNQGSGHEVLLTRLS